MKSIILSGFFYILLFVFTNINGEIEKENSWLIYNNDKYSISHPTSFDTYEGIKDVNDFDLKLIDNTITKTIITIHEKIPHESALPPEYLWNEEGISEGEKLGIYSDEIIKYEYEKKLQTY